MCARVPGPHVLQQHFPSISASLFADTITYFRTLSLSSLFSAAGPAISLIIFRIELLEKAVSYKAKQNILIVDIGG